METTRRDFLGAVGVAAAAAAMPGEAAAQAAAPSPKAIFYIAALTPCDKQLRFDPAWYKDEIAYFKSQGADGIVVLGTTGEYPSFSTAERKQVAETALKNRNGLKIIVQNGTSNFPETLELGKHAADNGADGLLCIPPFYYKNPALDGLVKYYSLLFEAVKIPIHLYHIPGTSAVPITHELLHALEKYPHLAGIKDSTGNAEGYTAFVKTFPKLNMMSGTENNLKLALENGMGLISAGANLLTKKVAAVFQAYRAGQSLDEPLAKMREASQLLRPAGVGSYGPMKYALSRLMGTRQVYQRPPHVDVTSEQIALIQTKLGELKAMA